MTAALVWCPFADEDSAAAVAAALLDEGLVTCANIVPGVRSLFIWRGQREDAREAGALFKTSGALLPRAIARIEALHPYDQPAVLGWHCDAANPATLDWVGGLPG
ncbi:MAG: divalent-cation tolerance protein CutA [Sphingomonadales bacterium]|nr:divalent-cation tolerance protein CutA [Sphingomonadales bacterium]